jgi:serine/threonine protein phosphatase PrpC
MPIITTTVITTLLTTLAQKGLDKAFETGSEKISEDAYKWIKSLFYKNNEPKKILKELQEDPQNKEKLSNANAIINNSIEDNPQFEAYLKEIIEKVPKTVDTISNSKNVITGNVNTGGGNFINGDNNQMSK